MSKTLNKVELIGNLGQDPESRTLPSGAPVTNLRLATHRTYKDRAGEQVRETEWFNVTCYDKLAEQTADYARKGRLVYVEGRFHTDAWNDKTSGDPRSRLEVVAREVIFLDSPTSNTNDTDDDVAPVTTAASHAAGKSAGQVVTAGTTGEIDI